MRRGLLTALAILFAISFTPSLDATENPSEDLVALAKRAKPLSTSDASASDHFSLLLDLTAAGIYSPTLLVGQRDGNDVSLLVCSTAGLPYLYLYDGRLIMLDARSPGRILVAEDISYELLYRSQNAAQIDFALNFWATSFKPTSQIDWYPSEIIQGTLAGQTGIVADTTTKTFVIRIPHRRLLVQESAKPYPIGILIVEAPNVSFTATSVIGKSVDDERFSPVGPVQLTGLGLPIVHGTGDDVNNLPKMAPDRFWTDPREVKAAESLAKLVPARAWIAEACERVGLQRMAVLQTIACDVAANAETRQKVFKIFENREALLRADVAAFKVDNASGGAAEEAILKDFDAADELGGALPSKGYYCFTHRLLENALATNLSDTIEQRLLKYLDESATLNLSDEQTEQVAALCLGTASRTEQLATEFKTGDLSADDFKVAWSATGVRMADGLDAILTPKQARQMRNDLLRPTTMPAN